MSDKFEAWLNNTANKHSMNHPNHAFILGARSAGKEYYEPIIKELVEAIRYARGFDNPIDYANHIDKALSSLKAKGCIDE
jgi:hypothetical protein